MAQFSKVMFILNISLFGEMCKDSNSGKFDPGIYFSHSCLCLENLTDLFVSFFLFSTCSELNLTNKNCIYSRCTT
jgi:hypothetical protein